MLFSVLNDAVQELACTCTECIELSFFDYCTGSTHFLRGELVGQHNVTLGPSLMGQPGLVASMAGSLGLVRPILAPQWALWATEADGQGTQGAAGSGDAGADKSSLKHGVLHLSDRLEKRLRFVLCVSFVALTLVVCVSCG
jgi:hypothetical protein